MSADKTKDSDLVLIDNAFLKQEKYLDRWLEYERYYKSKFSEKQYKKLKKSGRSKLFISTTRNTVNIVRSIFSTSFFSKGCPIELIDLNDNGGVKENSLTKVVKYYYDKLKPAKELNKAFLSALIFNIGIVAVYWDSEKKKVITAHVPITDIAFDPEARNIDDVEYFAYEFNESISSIKYKFEKEIYGKIGNKKALKIKEVFSDEQLELESSSKRHKVKEIYKRDAEEGWVYKTYINNKCVRKANIKIPPFDWGIALETIAYIDEDERAEQNLVYGESLVNYIKDLNDEINQKRNQKNDIQEEMINPSVYVGDKSGVNVNDLKKGPGKRIRVTGNVNDIKEIRTPSEYPLNADLSILDKDLSESSGVNSIQNGNTSSSDRRSAQALAVVNSNSTTRIADMIGLINETLFEHWAKDFVRLVLANADDNVVNRITGLEFPFGKKGSRDNLEYDMKINFGMSIDKDKRISDLMNMLLPILQSKNLNPAIVERVLKEVLSHFLGDNKMLDEIFTPAQEEGNGNASSDAGMDELGMLI